MSISTFEAKYPSKCPDCPVRIEEGDEVVYVHDTVVHAQCVEASVRRTVSESTGNVCGQCFTVRSVTGACACDPED